MNKRRFALVTGRTAEEGIVAAYLPRNYKVLGTVSAGVRSGVLIGGVDSMGWTFDAYVEPRLATGLYSTKEVTAEEVANLLFDEAFGIEHARYMDE